MALDALHAYRAWLDARHVRASMPAASPSAASSTTGICAACCCCRSIRVEVAPIGRLELARDRALEVWETSRDAQLPSPSPRADVRNEGAFLAYYEASLSKLIAFINSHADRRHPAVHRAVPHRRSSEGARGDVSGRFHESAADVLERSARLLFRSGLQSEQSEFLRRSRRANRCCRCSGTKASRATFCSSRYAYHNPDFVRHVQSDGVFAEGWAFYGEEMLMREGLYDDDPGARKQVIHLMRHRATRIGVDVGLATGEMTLPQAIAYFQKNAGIDYDTARGEATRFAMGPGQAIDYLVGKTQIETLIGLVQRSRGRGFLAARVPRPAAFVRHRAVLDDSLRVAGRRRRWLRPALDAARAGGVLKRCRRSPAARSDSRKLRSPKGHERAADARDASKSRSFRS